MSAWDGSRYRLVPSAVTPIQSADLLSGLVRHRQETGLEPFKRSIAEFLGAENVATYTSFRRAICACLREMRATVDDDRSNVLIPAYSCPDFYSAIRGAGLDVQCCDLDPQTLSIDMESVEDVSVGKTLAMIAVNHLGFGNRMGPIVDFCADNDIFLIEDLGYSFGAECNGQQLGTFGDCSVLNFQEGKAIPVGGGMVTTNRKSIAVSDDGRTATSPNRAILAGYKAFSHPVLYNLYYEVSDRLSRSGVLSKRVSTNTEAKKGIDYSQAFSTMSDFQGMIGRRIYARLDEYRQRRADTARYYARNLSGCDGLQTTHPVPSVSNAQYIRYPVLVDDPPSRSTIRAALNDAGIQTAALYNALDIDGNRYPNAERIRQSIITLPTHPYVTESDRCRVVETITGEVS